MRIRRFRPEDTKALKEITAQTFDITSIDKNIEDRFGLLNATDWVCRKLKHIDADIAANAEGIFVAEEEGQVIGYITTVLDYDTLLARIPNMAVAAGHQGKGVGKALMDASLAYMREKGMEHAKIEALAQNPVATTFYPRVGFHEVARQVHYVMKL
jgi:ribosomal protein S18 acetylase RimI-like enzyme